MDRVTGLIAANYETKALGSLTSERTIASLPYGGRYRMIDFPLSNMVNSGIQTVGLVTPYKYRSVMDHIGAGKEWGLDQLPVPVPAAGPQAQRGLPAAVPGGLCPGDLLRRGV